MGRRGGRRKGEMKRCHLCGSIKRRCYVEGFNNKKHTHLAVGWLCPLSKIFSYEHEKLYYLAISPKRKPKKRCPCGSATLRLYVKEPKTQKYTGVGWLCLRERRAMLDKAKLNELNASA